MPKFTHEPPIDTRGHGLPLLRTPTNGQLKFCCVSEHMDGCPTHWYGGRTIPCEENDCKPCSEGVPWRWHGYVAGLLSGDHRMALYEFTAQACEVINQYKALHATLRGCLITARRHRNKHNGRVLIQTQPAILGDTRLPHPPDLRKILSVIWNIPLPEMPAEDKMTRKPNMQVHAALACYADDPILAAAAREKCA